MVLAILLIGLTLEETLNLYSLALLEEIEECLVIILDPGLEALDGRRGNLHPTLLLGGLDGYTKTSDAALLKVSNFCVPRIQQASAKLRNVFVKALLWC